MEDREIRILISRIRRLENDSKAIRLELEKVLEKDVIRILGMDEALYLIGVLNDV